MKIRRIGRSEDRENEGGWKGGKERFGRSQPEGANTPRTVAPIEGDPKPRSYWCAVAPTGINQNRNVGAHHDRFLKKYDEFRGHAQMEPRL